MNITSKDVTIAELIEGFVDNGDNGVFGYGGKLTIRPDYQREFVYKPEQQKAVIETVRQNLPLGPMYWNKTGEDTYELLDGQQRTLSIAKFIKGAFGITEDGNDRLYINLTSDEKEVINNYKLDVRVCEGTESEKLKWFRTINIAGTVLTKQELLNAAYHGPWLEDAKRYFSKPNCAAAKLGDNYVKGSPIRQEILEKALEWITDKEGLKDIDKYMGKHQHDSNANELWLYYNAVITWAKATFPNPIKGIIDVQDWGILYNKYANKTYDPKALTTEIKKLNLDDDVTKKSGIIPWLLSERKPTDERFLSIRTFTLGQKLKAFTNQEGACPICQNKFEFNEMEGDHIVPWSRGGRTVDENLQMLCKNCNSIKSGK